VLLLPLVVVVAGVLVVLPGPGWHHRAQSHSPAGQEKQSAQPMWHIAGMQHAIALRAEP